MLTPEGRVKFNVFLEIHPNEYPRARGHAQSIFQLDFDTTGVVLGQKIVATFIIITNSLPFVSICYRHQLLHWEITAELDRLGFLHDEDAWVAQFRAPPEERAPTPPPLPLPPRPATAVGPRDEAERRFQESHCHGRFPACLPVGPENWTSVAADALSCKNEKCPCHGRLVRALVPPQHWIQAPKVSV